MDPGFSQGGGGGGGGGGLTVHDHGKGEGEVLDFVPFRRKHGGTMWYFG